MKNMNRILENSIDNKISEDMKKYNQHDDEKWGKLKLSDRYVISTYGQIVRLTRTAKHFDPYTQRYIERTWKERLIEGTPDEDGYLRVGIYTDINKFKNVGVHQMVADTFLVHENPALNTVVNHIDGDILNNNVDNLEWCTPKDNTRNSIDRQTFCKPVKPVKCLDTGETYRTVMDASIATGVPYDALMNSLRNKHRSNHHLTFIYDDGSVDNESNYLIESVRNFKPVYSNVKVDCLDSDISFDSIKEAADWVGVSSDKLTKCMKDRIPVKGHVFIRHEDNYRDKERYMNYCYTRSEVYADLATEPVYTLSDRAIVLSSGGLDSTTCLALAVSEYGSENVTSVSVYYGQKHSKELKRAQEIAKYYNVKHVELDMSPLYKYSNSSLLVQSTENIPEGSYASQLKNKEKSGELSALSTVVPLRNGVMLSAVTALAMSLYPDLLVDVYLGNHADDAAGHAYADCTSEFTYYMRKAMLEGSYNKVYLISPFVNSTKADIVSVGLKLNVPYELTTSCYRGGEKACGKCGTCIDRLAAFRANHATDPIEYEEG